MEYEKFIVSLYKDGEISAQSGIFICIEKRADKSILTLNNSGENAQYLFIHFDNKYIMIKIDDRNSFNFGYKFDKQKEYVFCLYFDNTRYVGIHNKKGNYDKILETMNNQYIALKTKSIFVDKNSITDELILKLFDRKENFLFFDQIKDKLIYLFSAFGRNKPLEDIVKYSKFVEFKNTEGNSFLGIVYKMNKPFLLAVGYENLNDDVDIDITEYHHVTTKDELGQFHDIFLTFRRASDGDLYFEENLILKH